MLKSILGFENWTKKCQKVKIGNTFQLFFFDVIGISKNQGFIFIFQMIINMNKVLE